MIFSDLCLMILCLLPPSSSLAGGQIRYVLTENGKSLNVRDLPGKKGSVILRLANGSKVANAIIENTDAASRQGLAGGMVGYIASGATAEQVFTSCEVYNTVLKARMSELSLTSGKLIGAIQGSSDGDVVRISGTTVMVNFQGQDEAAAAQQSPYGADQLIGGNQQGHGHIYINNVEQPLNN